MSESDISDYQKVYSKVMNPADLDLFFFLRRRYMCNKVLDRGGLKVSQSDQGLLCLLF